MADSTYMSKESIETAVQDKLGEIFDSFDITTAVIDAAIKDMQREMKISDVTTIDDMSERAMYVELRALYWVLFRTRNSASTFFKYTTSIDGRAVDKTNIPKTIETIMLDIDTRYKNFMISYNSNSVGGGVLNTWHRVPCPSQQMFPSFDYGDADTTGSLEPSWGNKC